MPMVSVKKISEGIKTTDDSLFGLLSSYKPHTAYFRILASTEEKRAVLLITDNPRCWLRLPAERYAAYASVRRQELGATKLSVKYLTAANIVRTFGPTLGVSLPKKKTTVVNELDQGGCFLLEFPIDDLPLVLQAVRKIITLSPQRKYEIIETCLTEI